MVDRIQRYRRLGLWFSLFALCILSVDSALTQEVSFTPRYDGVSHQAEQVKRTPTPKVEDVVRAPQLYSLARFNSLFQDMCRLLVLDRRQERVFIVAQSAAEDEQECPTCRAFARQVAQSCATKASPKRSATPVPTAESGKQAAADVAGPKNEVGGTPLYRYPRTDLIDVLSRLSDSLYEFSPGQGPVFEALKSFEHRLSTAPDLTIGEKEYYGIVLAYLYSAWAGRPGSPLESATPSPEEVAELFKH
jgi:hypothetical protein